MNNMKKQIKDLNYTELEKVGDNDQILKLIGLYTIYGSRDEITFNEMYDIVCKIKSILEEEIEVEE